MLVLTVPSNQAFIKGPLRCKGFLMKLFRTTTQYLRIITHKWKSVPMQMGFALPNGLASLAILR
jgi:hypothetical protein